MRGARACASIRSKATGAMRREGLAPGLAPAAGTGGAGTGTRASVHRCGEESTARFGNVLRATRQRGLTDAGRARRGNTRISRGPRRALSVQLGSFRQWSGPRRAQHVKHVGRGHTQRRGGKFRRGLVRNARWGHSGSRQGAARALNAGWANIRRCSAQLPAWYARTAARGSTPQA